MKFCLFFLFFILSQVILAAPPTVRLNDNDWPPYFFGGRQGEPRGLAKELLEICMPTTGYQFQFTFYPIKRMRKYMESGELDINIYSYRPSRELFLIFGKEPIFSASYKPVARKESNISINSINDFEKYLVGHLLGFRYSPEFYNYIQHREKQGSLLTTSKSEYILELLMERRIDVYVETTAGALYYAKKLGITDKIEIVDFDIKTSNYYVSVSKRSNRIKNKKNFLNKLDACIAETKLGAALF